MADKEVIVKVDYDVDSAIKSLDTLSEEIARNKKVQESLKQEYKDGEIALEDYSKANAILGEKNKKLNAERAGTIKLLQSEKGSINELRSQVNKLTKERNALNLNTKEGKQRLTEINKEIETHNSVIKGNVDGLTKQKMNIGNYQSALEGLPGPLGGVVGGIGQMTKASLRFLATPIGAVIGALSVAVLAVKSAFTASEAGQNKYNKLMGILGTIVGNLTDLLSDLGEKIISLFENPQQSIKDFGNLIKTQITNSFNGWLELIPALGKSIKLLFKGEFKEAGKTAVNALAKATLGVEDLTDKIEGAIDATKEFIDENVREANIAANIANMRAKADKIERDLITKRGEIEAKVAELRVKARKEDEFSASQRKSFLEEAIKLQSGLFKEEEAMLSLRSRAKKIENSLSKSTKEDLMEEARLQADVASKVRDRFNGEKEMMEELKTINSKISTEKIKNLNEEQKAYNEYEKTLEDFFTYEGSPEQKADLERDKRRGEAIIKLAELKQKELEVHAQSAEELRALQEANEIQSFEAEMARTDLLDEERELKKQEHMMRMEEIEQQHNDSIRAQREQMLQEAFAGMQQIIAATQGMGDKRVAILGDAFSRISTINFDEIESNADKVAAIGQAASVLSNLVVKNYDEEFSALESNKAKALKAAGDDKEKQIEIERRFAKKTDALKTKQAKEEKAKALIDIGIATAIAVAKAMGAMPFPPFPFAIAAGALGAIQLASVASKKIPTFNSAGSFAKGGGIDIGGQSHLQGGTHFWGSDGTHFEAELGEKLFVLKKDAASQINALSAINEAYGGRSFGVKSNYLAEGGEVSTGLDQAGLTNAIMEGLKNIQIVTRVDDIKTGLTNLDSVNRSAVI